MTTGVIHSWKKTTTPLIPLNLTETNPQQNNYSLIAADIRLAPGNSGGVLANARGEAIGSFSHASHYTVLNVKNIIIFDEEDYRLWL